MRHANRNPLQKDKFAEKNRLRNQLVIRLKHHHHEILKQVPLEIAINGMYEAWRACYSEADHPQLSGIPTEINPKMNKLGSVARHLNRRLELPNLDH